MINGRNEKKDFQDGEKGELLRRFKANPAVFIGTVVILLIIIIAFVFVPAIPGVSMSGNSELIFGFYGKTPISYHGYFAEQQARIMRRLQEEKRDVSNTWIQLQVGRAAFEQTVTHIAILDEMKKAGYIAVDEAVNLAVAGLPQFQENGVFSSARYRQLDKVSRAVLWREVQESLAEEWYGNDFGGLLISSNEAAFVKAMASPERSFNIAVYSFDSYPDAETSAFAELNKELFQVTRLSKITVKSNESEAKQVLETIRNGTSSFEDAAKAHSSDADTAEKGGDMGVKMAYELRGEIKDEASRNTVIGLAKGNFSAIIKTDAGWTFFRAEEDPHPADLSDASMLLKVKAYILEFERGSVEDFFLKLADSLVSDIKAKGFDAALIEKSLAKKQFGPVSLNFGNNELLPPLNSSIPELGNAISNKNFWQIAFSTPLLTPSTPFSLGDGVAVLFPTGENPIDETTGLYIESDYFPVLSSIMNQKIRNTFIGNGKLKDNFYDVYSKLFIPR